MSNVRNIYTIKKPNKQKNKKKTNTNCSLNS